MARHAKPAREDPLTGPAVVFDDALVLNDLAREWMRRGQFSAETVVELQSALHELEIQRVQQAVSVNITITTPAEGLIYTAPAPSPGETRVDLPVLSDAETTQPIRVGALDSQKLREYEREG